MTSTPLALVGRLALLFGSSLKAAPQVARLEVYEQAFEVAAGSAFFVSLTMAFTGAILVIQSAGQAAQVLGDTSPIGGVFLQLLISEFGPLVACLLVAARYGAGVAAQLAAMVVTEQVDALRLCGASPVVFLVAPRVWGAMLGIVPVVALATLAAWLAGMGVAASVYHISPSVFADLRQTHLRDVLVGVSKAVVFGAAIPTVASWAGLQARHGAQAVGAATTRAVIGASVALLLLDFVISLLVYALHVR